MPDNKTMPKYQKMLDEIAGRYPELEDAVTDFHDALMDAMEPAPKGKSPDEESDEPALEIEIGGEPSDDEEEPSAPPFMKKGKKAPRPADDQEDAEDEDDSSAPYKF